MKIILDYNQERLNIDRLHIASMPIDFDEVSASNTFIDPVNKFCILKPYRLDEAWFTSNSSSYAKLASGSFTQTTGTWEELAIPSAGAGPWMSLTPASSGGGLIATTSTYNKNTGFCLSIFNYTGNQSTNTEPIKFGYGTSSSSSSGYFALYGDGTIDYYRDGNLYITDSISSIETNQKSKNQGVFFDLMVMPMLDNKILVWSLNGGSFVIDTEVAAVTGTITPQAKLFVESASGQSCLFQLAQLKYHTSGNIVTRKMNFIEPPDSGASLVSWNNPSWIGTENYRVYGYNCVTGTQDCTISLRDWNDNTFTNNDTNTEAKLKFNLTTTDELYSPTIVGGQIAYDWDYANTVSGSVDITCYVSNATLDVAQDPRNTSFSFTIVEAASAAAVVSGLYNGVFKPVLVLDDNDVAIFEGLVDSVSVSVQGLLTLINVTCRDGFMGLSSYTFQERVPLGYEYFHQVVEFLAGKFNSATEVSSGTFRLPWAPSTEMEDMGYIAEIGQTADEVLVDLFETYAATWKYGYRPTSTGVKFFAWSPSDFPGSTYTLYDDRATALSVGGSTSVNDVWYSYESDIIPAEATRVYVTGRNPFTDTLFQYKKVDYNAENVNLAVGSRPVNWAGFILPYGIIDPAITTEEAAEYACEIIFNRITQPRLIVGVEAPYMVNSGIPLWVGDSFSIYGTGDYRITSLRIDWVIDDTTKATVLYAGEKE